MTADFQGNVPDITVVIPMYNSAEIFPELYRRLVATFQDNSIAYEIIAVLDGCRDNSFSVINQLARNDQYLKIIEFSRNFGHQSALSAGLKFATGSTIAIIDDDLEDPPELLPIFMQKIQEGFDVVYGIRRNRQRLLMYRILYSVFYRLFDFMTDINIPYDAGEFCIMTRRVRDTLICMPENNRYLRGMRAWVGFKQAGIEYSREKRYAGEPGYSIRQYIQLALNAIFSFSYKPLKCVIFFGMLLVLVSCEEFGRIIFRKLGGQVDAVPGWVYLALGMVLLAGIQLLAIGIVGEYIARIYDEVKQRPKFVIASLVNLEQQRD